MGDKKAEPETARKILERILESPTDNASYVVEENEGERFLTYGYESPYGTIYINYLPTGLVETLIKDCDATLDKVLEGVVVRSVNGEERSQKLNEKTLDESERKLVVEAYATITARFVIEGLNHKLGWALEEEIDEALTLAGAAIQTSIAEDLKGRREAEIEVDVVGVKEEFNSLIKSAAAERKRFLDGSFKRFFPKPSLETLGERYTALLPIWHDAKRIYKRNKNRPSWQSMVRGEHPTLPDDLIERLSRQGDSTPSDIALEHAARLCGVRVNQYTSRHLYNLMKSSTNTVTELRIVDEVQ